jgi:hypothetical protein
MCVLCYTMGSGIGEAALFGGPVAFTVVRKVRARIGGLIGGEAEPADIAAAAPEVPRSSRQSTPVAPAPTPASA